MIKLGGLVTLKPINEAEDDKYVSIGFGRFKEKGKEKDKDAPTFTKDGEKFVPTKGDTAAKGGDSSAGEEKPKVNIFNKPSSDKQEPKLEPSQPKLESDPRAEKVAEKIVKKYNITPEKMGEEDYKIAMGRAVYSALTNTNFHTEARELIAKLEGKPELAEKPDYPKMDDPQFQEKMKAITDKYQSEYSERDSYSSLLGRETSDAAEWDGVKSVGTLTKQLRDNGMSEFADEIESIFDNKGYMKKEGKISLSKLV